MKIDKNLKSLLKSSDTTVAQLARATGISSKTIYHWLEGQKPRDINQIKKVSDHFKITLDQLCFHLETKETTRTTSLDEYQEEINAGIFEVVLRKVRR